VAATLGAGQGAFGSR